MTTLDDLLRALGSTDSETRVTSVRQSKALGSAISAAVALGWAPSGNEGINGVVRDSLEAFARELALEEHFEVHPHLRPSLAELTQAVAELDHDPLADSPDLLAQAAAEIVLVKPDADPDDVLVWALSLRSRASA